MALFIAVRKMRVCAFALTTVVAVASGSAAASGAASTRPPLSEVQSINDGLLAIGIADEIRNKCENIEARMLRAFGFINQLLNEAVALGYSRAEIDAFRNSKAEKARLRKRGEAYLAANGVKPEQPETLCHLGQAEIARNTQVGQLLRAR